MSSASIEKSMNVEIHMLLQVISCLSLYVLYVRGFVNDVHLIYLAHEVQ